MNDNFKFVIPAEIVKGKDGEWKVAGLASTPSIDRQGEVIMQEGIDATPIDSGKGFFNFDHDNSPESTIGVLDRYRKSERGLYVSGRLFKNHTRAKAVYEIMSSLDKSDTGRVGMSVEGKVIERDPLNPRIIKRCVIRNVALTLNPVNQDTYADVIKSMSGDAQVDFESTGKPSTALAIDGMAQAVEKTEPTFTPTQVVSMIEKALGVGGGYTAAPGNLSGGAALAQESLDGKKKKKSKEEVKKSIYQSKLEGIMSILEGMYPETPREVIWEAIKERMNTHYK